MRLVFENFLASTEVEVANKLAGAVARTDAREDAAIRLIFAGWKPKQAVANLLIHPQLIPADIRLPFVRRGLHDPHLSYFWAATAIGVTRSSVGDWPPEYRKRILRRLLALTHSGIPIVEASAGAAAASMIDEETLWVMGALLGHSNPSVSAYAHRRVLRKWGKLSITKFARLLADARVPAAVHARVLFRHAIYQCSPSPFRARMSLRLYITLPNLCDLRDGLREARSEDTVVCEP